MRRQEGSEEKQAGEEKSSFGGSGEEGIQGAAGQGAVERTGDSFAALAHGAITKPMAGRQEANRRWRPCRRGRWS